MYSSRRNQILQFSPLTELQRWAAVEEVNLALRLFTSRNCREICRLWGENATSHKIFDLEDTSHITEYYDYCTLTDDEINQSILSTGSWPLTGAINSRYDTHVLRPIQTLTKLGAYLGFVGFNTNLYVPLDVTVFLAIRTNNLTLLQHYYPEYKNYYGDVNDQLFYYLASLLPNYDLFIFLLQNSLRLLDVHTVRSMPNKSKLYYAVIAANRSSELHDSNPYLRGYLNLEVVGKPKFDYCSELYYDLGAYDNGLMSAEEFVRNRLKNGGDGYTLDIVDLMEPEIFAEFSKSLNSVDIDEGDSLYEKVVLTIEDVEKVRKMSQLVREKIIPGPYRDALLIFYDVILGHNFGGQKSVLSDNVTGWKNEIASMATCVGNTTIVIPGDHDFQLRVFSDVMYDASVYANTKKSEFLPLQCWYRNEQFKYWSLLEKRRLFKIKFVLLNFEQAISKAVDFFPWYEQLDVAIFVATKINDIIIVNNNLVPDLMKAGVAREKIDARRSYSFYTHKLV